MMWRIFTCAYLPSISNLWVESSSYLYTLYYPFSVPVTYSNVSSFIFKISNLYSLFIVNLIRGLLIGDIAFGLVLFSTDFLFSISLISALRSDQSLSHVRLFATPWIAARQASLSITNSRSSPRLTSTESVMPSSHLILCRPLLLLPPIPPSNSLFQSVNSLHEVAKVLEFQL